MTTDLANLPALGTILGVWAHPDDEAYLSAALMARARDNGQRVVMVTATSGEHGTTEPDRWPPERLGPLRRRELAASLAVLGVTEHHLLGHPDGGCHLVPSRWAAGQIARLMATVQPDTIVTFGPDGMTGHRDHRAVSAWTSAAWETLGRPGRLLHATVTPQFHTDWATVNDELGVWFDGTTPPCTASRDLAVNVVCDDRLLDRKLAALRAHASQTGPLIERLGELTYRRWWAAETFVDAGALELSRRRRIALLAGSSGHCA